MYRQDLALNNLQRLYGIKINQTKPNQIEVASTFYLRSRKNSRVPAVTCMQILYYPFFIVSDDTIYYSYKFFFFHFQIYFLNFSFDHWFDIYAF